MAPPPTAVETARTGPSVRFDTAAEGVTRIGGGMGGGGDPYRPRYRPKA